MPQNRAAWQNALATPLVIQPAPYTSPHASELVIANHAIAVNPADHVLQTAGLDAFAYISYPFIFGEDVAGTVTEVGSAVTRFKVGDRVLAICLGTVTNRASEGAFQAYSIVAEHMTSPIPESMKFEEAAIFPLGLTTAASGLFQKDRLALQYPSAHAEPTGQALLIWGGASSVGCNAIQLAVAAGYEVFVTASPSNFDLVERLGASQVFDYHSSSVVDDIVATLKDKMIAGALNAAPGGTEPCLTILERSKGNKFLATASLPKPEILPEGVKVEFVQSTNIRDTEVSKVVFEDFLPEALAQGKFVAAPEPRVVGHGLEFVQEALDVLKKGVSASKLVVTL
ncbi:uncharacterized protein KY384_002796 [Bacidia gigantensis]|uniref:uncharacterized protein n=1 Tax=Bacidia gigantensis TaxID=2732470 RepID=UPI001D05A4EB|nr:uncharacterized protein KY384_002796 [Bacidia gigantensis]KAG8532918.1 hypothetical protein KY384_002796 [Bacidia gigantensis]